MSCIKAHISPGKEVQFSELRIKSVFIHYGLHITESFKTETFLSISFYGYRDENRHLLRRLFVSEQFIT